MLNPSASVLDPCGILYVCVRNCIGVLELSKSFFNIFQELRRSTGLIQKDLDLKHETITSVCKRKSSVKRSSM